MLALGDALETLVIEDLPLAHEDVAVVVVTDAIRMWHEAAACGEDLVTVKTT